MEYKARARQSQQGIVGLALARCARVMRARVARADAKSEGLARAVPEGNCVRTCGVIGRGLLRKLCASARQYVRSRRARPHLRRDRPRRLRSKQRLQRLRAALIVWWS